MATEETYEGILADLEPVEAKLSEIYGIPRERRVDEMRCRLQRDEIGEYDHEGLPARWLYLRSAKADWEESVIPKEWMKMKVEREEIFAALKEQSPGLKEVLAWHDSKEAEYDLLTEHEIGAPAIGLHGRSARLLRFFHAEWCRMKQELDRSRGSTP